MRCRGWSLVLIFVCWVAYTFHYRTYAKSIESSVKSSDKPRSDLSKDSRSPAVRASLRTSTNAYLYQAQEPVNAAAVNGVNIATDVLNQRTNYLLERRPSDPERTITADERQQLFESVRSSLLQEMIEDLLLIQTARDAERTGTVQVPVADVPLFLADLIRQFPTETDFQRAYPHYLFTRDDFVKDRIRKTGLQKNLTANLTPSLEEFQTYYNDHRAEFNEHGRLLSFDEAQGTNWVTRSVMRSKVQNIMGTFLQQRRQQGTVTIFLTAPQRQGGGQ